MNETCTITNRKADKMPTVADLFKQMMDLHVKIAPESYTLKKNYKKFVEEKLNIRDLFEYRIENKLVGMAMYFIHPIEKRKTFFITDFVIDKKFRRKGHGRKMFKALLAIARGMNCDQIQLTVASKNLPARMLYESFGLKPTVINMYKEIK